MWIYSIKPPFFWSTTFLEPDFLNQISRTRFLEPIFYTFLEKWLQNKWSTAYSILLWTMMMIKMGLETTLWIVLRFAGLSPASLPTIWPAGQQPNKPKRYLATQIGNKDKDNSLEDSYPDVAMAPRVVSFCTMKPNSFWSHIWDFTRYLRILNYQTMKGNLRILYSAWRKL